MYWYTWSFNKCIDALLWRLETFPFRLVDANEENLNLRSKNLGSGSGNFLINADPTDIGGRYFFLFKVSEEPVTQETCPTPPLQPTVESLFSSLPPPPPPPSQLVQTSSMSLLSSYADQSDDEEEEEENAASQELTTSTSSLSCWWLWLYRTNMS